MAHETSADERNEYGHTSCNIATTLKAQALLWVQFSKHICETNMKSDLQPTSGAVPYN
jgi:hypothetical protein